MRDLPYVFDLLYDVKTMEQVGRIARYEGDCSDATPLDLYELFMQQGMPVPDCLSDCNRKICEQEVTMLDLTESSDPEAAHLLADKLLVEVLLDLGYVDLIKYYNQVPKWYS